MTTIDTSYVHRARIEIEKSADPKAQWIKFIGDLLDIEDFRDETFTQRGIKPVRGYRLAHDQQEIPVDVSECDFVPRDLHGVKWIGGCEVRWHGYIDFDACYVIQGAPVGKEIAVFVVVLD